MERENESLINHNHPSRCMMALVVILALVDAGLSMPKSKQEMGIVHEGEKQVSELEARGWMHLNNAKIKIGATLPLLMEQLKKPQEQWGYADKQAWNEGIKTLKIALSEHRTVLRDRRFRQNEPDIDTSNWPIQIRVSVANLQTPRVVTTQ